MGRKRDAVGLRHYLMFVGDGSARHSLSVIKVHIVFRVS